MLNLIFFGLVRGAYYRPSLEHLTKTWDKNRKSVCVEWLCTEERWNPEVVNIFGAAARYRQATAGSSHYDAHPDNLTLHAGKIYSSPLGICGVLLLLLR
jgi:hypothetical protein